MRRRRLIMASAGLGLAAVAGCSALGGPSEEAQAEVEAATTDLEAAGESFEGQMNQFGSLGSEVSYDPAPMRESLDAAREHLDTAEERAQTDATRSDIERLRLLADFLALLVDMGEALAAAHSQLRSGGTAMQNEAFDRSVSALERGQSTVSDMRSDIRDAESTLGELREATEGEETDLSQFETTITEFSSLRDGYGLLFATVLPFAQGFRRFQAADSDREAQEYEAASEGFTQSTRFFAEAQTAVAEAETDAVPEGMATAATGVAGTAALLEGLAAASARLAEAAMALETGTSYIGAERYEDAIGELERADSLVSEARENLEAGRDAADAFETEGASPLGAIEAQNREERLTRLSDLLAGMDSLATGLVEYVEGTQLFQSASAAGDAGNYTAAADQYATAAERFAEAESTFTTAEEDASGGLRQRLISFGCQAGAFSDASETLVEANTALADGDGQTANARIEEARTQLQRCDSSGGSGAQDLAIGAVGRLLA